jgi:hypothetical protein
MDTSHFPSFAEKIHPHNDVGRGQQMGGIGARPQSPLWLSIIQAVQTVQWVLFSLFMDDHLSALVVTAIRTDPMRQFPFMTLRALDQILRRQSIMRAPTIASPG